MRGCLIAFLLLLVAGAYGQASRPVGAALDDDLAAKLGRMRALMLEGIERQRPSGRGFTDSLAKPKRTMFRGSYDRHSNMAAYWSLLSWGRRSDDESAIRALTKAFTAEALRAEREFLEILGPRSDVRPYDDAWLLLLLREVERAVDDPQISSLARELAAEAEVRLLAFAEGCVPPVGTAAASPTESAPATRSRRPRAPSSWLSGAYDSAVWPMLVLQLCPSPNEKTRERVTCLHGQRIVAARALSREVIEKSARRNFDFLWPDAMLTLSDALASQSSKAIGEYLLPPYDAPPEDITLLNCHSIGREVVKLWPLAFQAGAGDLASRRSFNDRLRLCLEREESWAGPFLTVSHWVPQFVYFAVWLADGRP